MTKKQFENLNVGDIVRSRSGADGYVVIRCYGKEKLITDVRMISNPEEWNLILKSKLKRVNK